MALFSRLLRKAPERSLPGETLHEPAASGQRAHESAAATELAAGAGEEQTLQAAIDGQDMQEIARLVVAGRSTRVRQLAAHAVTDPQLLRRLIRDVRGGNDKGVYRILTAKRDALLGEARQLEHLQAQLDALASALERHSRRPYEPLYAPTLEQLENRWKAVAAHATADRARSVEQAINRSREVIAQHLRQVATQASCALAAANAAAAAQRERDLAQQAAATAAAERARAQEIELRARAERQAAQERALNEIGALIRKALGALNAGSTGRAAGLRRALEEKLASAPALPADLSSLLRRLDAKLAELRDWNSFSVAPKRREVIEAMEALPDAQLDPSALAERIRTLQQQWRTLSKGAGENLEADWERFQAAARKAYQPCREYFEAQALVRQENLRQRLALLERLAAFEAGHDWQEADWRQVISALRESRSQWRRYTPVDRAAAAAVEERFNALTASLQRRLDAEYERNVKQKTLLIERARRLAEEDSRKAIEVVKELQQKWRAVGPVPRAAGCQLWEEFRRHCDAVFQRRQQQHAEHASVLQSNRDRACALCEQVEAIASLGGAQLLQRAAELAGLRTDFETIGELPKGSERELRERFERALSECQKALARQQAHAAQRRWSDLFAAVDRIRTYRLAVTRAAPRTEQEALRQQAEELMSGVTQWPKGALEALRAALAAQGGADLAANEAALRKLCIRAEVLTDMPTPAEDLPLRREYQVQRLLRGMGQGIRPDAAELDAMAIEWVGIGPTEDAPYAQLVERFKRCRGL